MTEIPTSPSDSSCLHVFQGILPVTSYQLIVYISVPDSVLEISGRNPVWLIICSVFAPLYS